MFNSIPVEPIVGPIHQVQVNAELDSIDSISLEHNYADLDTYWTE